MPGYPWLVQRYATVVRISIYPTIHLEYIYIYIHVCMYVCILLHALNCIHSRLSSFSLIQYGHTMSQLPPKDSTVEFQVDLQQNTGSDVSNFINPVTQVCWHEADGERCMQVMRHEVYWPVLAF